MQLFHMAALDQRTLVKSMKLNQLDLEELKGE